MYQYIGAENINKVTVLIKYCIFYLNPSSNVFPDFGPMLPFPTEKFWEHF